MIKIHHSLPPWPITSLEEFLDMQSNGSVDTPFEDVHELFDEDKFEEPQSNTIGDKIILFLLLIITLVLKLCIYLLYLIIHCSPLLKKI